MNAMLRTSLIAAALALAVPAASAGQSNTTSGANANRIVGMWSAQVDAGPCAGGPRRQFRAMNVYHTGGTLTDTNAMPPTSRGPAFGLWSWNQQNGSYDTRMQFYRYLPDGSFDGVQDIHREITLSADGNSSSDIVYVRVLNADDTLRVELCGTATATRVTIE
jgi:hypothetical protein